ncbi:MAG: MFS transporter [Alphaproteobacteria bacterium]|nr:MFS transporter [Alphaproteobacteria bacterium]
MKRPSNVQLLYWHNFLLYFRPLDPLAVLYFNEVTGSFTAAMGIFAISKISAILLEIPTGILSDRIGRKKTFILGTLTGIIATIFYALAASSFFLLLGAALEGTARTFFSGTRNAFLYEVLKETGAEKEYSRDLGRTSSFIHAGLGLGALAAIPFADISLRLVVAVGIIPQILAFLVCLFLVEPKIHLQEKQKSFSILWAATQKLWQNKRLLVFTCAQSLARGIDDAGYRFRSAFIAPLWPVWGISVLAVFDHIGAVITYWSAGKIIEKITPKWIIIGFEFLTVGCKGIAVLLNNVFSPLIMVIPAFGFGPMMTAKEHIVQNEFTDSQRATMGSIGSLLQALCYLVIALLMGAVADHWGPAVAILAVIVIQLAVTPLYARFFKQ